MAIQIILADSQYLTRAGFRHLFRDHKRIAVAGEATNSDELFHLVKEKHPDIIVFDYHDSEAFSIEDVREVRSMNPKINFVIVTADQEKSNIFQVLSSGVNCILTKNCSEEELISGIQATARNEKFFCNTVLDIILEKHLNDEEEEPDCAPTSLTARELEVVELVGLGISTREIADRLHLSIHTVYTHRKNIMKKLQINSVSEMVLYAVNAGIISREGE